MFARKASILSSLTGSSVPVRALFRISPLLLSIPMHQQSIQNSSQRLALLGLSCLGVAMSLLYFLMTQDQSKPIRPRDSLKGLPAEPKP